MVAVLAVIVLLAAPVTSTRTYQVVLAARETNVVGEPLTVNEPPPVIVMAVPWTLLLASTILKTMVL